MSRQGLVWVCWETCRDITRPGSTKDSTVQLRMPAFRRKNIRLPAVNYLGPRWYFLTICVSKRRPVFGEPRASEWILRETRTACAEYSFFLHAYCVMPDHLHLLVQGSSDTSDLLGFVRQFKRRTGQVWEKKNPFRLWQHKYYDHILRNTDSPEAVAWYLWLNPVRKGICERTDQYPFSGSLTIMKSIHKPAGARWIPPWKKNL